jgi:hypothetical protein
MNEDLTLYDYDLLQPFSLSPMTEKIAIRLLRLPTTQQQLQDFARRSERQIERSIKEFKERQLPFQKSGNLLSIDREILTQRSIQIQDSTDKNVGKEPATLPDKNVGNSEIVVTDKNVGSTISLMNSNVSKFTDKNVGKVETDKNVGNSPTDKNDGCHKDQSKIVVAEGDTEGLVAMIIRLLDENQTKNTPKRSTKIPEDQNLILEDQKRSTEAKPLKSLKNSDKNQELNLSEQSKNLLSCVCSEYVPRSGIINEINSERIDEIDSNKNDLNIVLNDLNCFNNKLNNTNINSYAGARAIPSSTNSKVGVQESSENRDSFDPDLQEIESSFKSFSEEDLILGSSQEDQKIKPVSVQIREQMRGKTARSSKFVDVYLEEEVYDDQGILQTFKGEISIDPEEYDLLEPETKPKDQIPTNLAAKDQEFLDSIDLLYHPEDRKMIRDRVDRNKFSDNKRTLELQLLLSDNEFKDWTYRAMGYAGPKDRVSEVIEYIVQKAQKSISSPPSEEKDLGPPKRPKRPPKPFKSV